MAESEPLSESVALTVIVGEDAVGAFRLLNSSHTPVFAPLEVKSVGPLVSPPG